jgi:hypothetical protein
LHFIHSNQCFLLNSFPKRGLKRRNNYILK